MYVKVYGNGTYALTMSPEAAGDMMKEMKKASKKYKDVEIIILYNENGELEKVLYDKNRKELIT